MIGQSSAEGESSNTLRRVDPVALAAPESDCEVIAYSADSANDAIVVWRRGRHPDRWLISRQHEDHIVALVDTAARPWERNLLVQPMPEGILLATPHCPWTPEGPAKNAAIIGTDGLTIVEATLDGGISHLHTTSTGTIWVGYSDEGIYASAEWSSEGRAPMGTWGLARFDSSLTKVWDYSPESAASAGALHIPIAECQSLNVTDEQTFAYTYPHFPLVQLGVDDIHNRCTGTVGAQEVLVNGSACAILGGYGTDRDRISIGYLDDECYVEQSSGILDLCRRPPMGPWPTLITRGAQLNVFHDQQWDRFRLQSEHVDGPVD
ncbi:MAG: hypothetical protein JWQ12_1848 [Glaciihabitans sp.]|nr:hypothetical protein [Glaciihabitans sp.]